MDSQGRFVEARPCKEKPRAGRGSTFGYTARAAKSGRHNTLYFDSRLSAAWLDRFPRFPQAGIPRVSEHPRSAHLRAAARRNSCWRVSGDFSEQSGTPPSSRCAAVNKSLRAPQGRVRLIGPDALQIGFAPRRFPAESCAALDFRRHLDHCWRNKGRRQRPRQERRLSLNLDVVGHIR